MNKIINIIALLVIIFFECVVIVFAIYKYFQYKNKNVLGISSQITILKKDKLIFPINSEYSEYYEPKPNLIEVEQLPWSSESATYTINSDSLNDRYEYSIPKQDNVYRIIALGDPFTFGHYVNTNENWTEILEDSLNRTNTCTSYKLIEILNLGVRGYDLNFAAERFRLRGLKYSPDLIIWFINNHNFYMVRQLMSEYERFFDSQLTNVEKQNLQKRGNWFPSFRLAIQKMMNQYLMENLVEQEFSSLHIIDSLYTGPIIFVTNNIESKYMALLKIFQKNRSATTLIYYSPDINVEPNAKFPDGHPNQQGHEIYAKQIADYLNQQRIPCKK